MNKLIIPTILIATVLVAGIFAFMPVEQASTVHETIIADIGGVAIDLVNVAGGTNVDNNAVNVLINVAGIVTDEHFEGRLLLQVTDVDTIGNGDDVTVLVQTWDDDEWLTIDTVTAPDDGSAFTIIEVVGESVAGGEIRLVVDEGAGNTESLIDAQGFIKGT